MLLKNDELSEYSKKLMYEPRFGIMFTALTYYHLNPFNEKPEDYEILQTKYDQPMMYVYGKNDSYFYELAKGAVVPEGNYDVIVHSGSHVVPKLISPEIDPLVEFIFKRYYEKQLFHKHTSMSFSKFRSTINLKWKINKEFKANFQNGAFDKLLNIKAKI